MLFSLTNTNDNLEALKQLHVIQRTPEPEPEPVPDLVDMIDDLTAEEQLEMRELAAKLKKRRHKAIASGADQLDKSGDDSNLGRKKRRTSGSISVGKKPDMPVGFVT